MLPTVVLVALAGAGLAARSVPAPRVPPTGEMRAASDRLLPSASLPASPAPEPPRNPRTRRERLLAAAYEMRGIPYKWGAKGPDELDCSGFTKAAYAAVGVRLPDGSFNQAKPERALRSLDELAPGDLLFYRWSGSTRVSHVTIYAGRGWAIGTGSPGQPWEVTVYPLADDMRVRGSVITYRHIAFADD